MSSSIYTGPWINWSDGAVRGAVVTLSRRDGGYLTTFIATFITIVGAQLWRIVSFVVHQIRASDSAQDGLHHQQQNIFRNTATPAGAVWSFALQMWFWRKRVPQLLLRTLPLVVFGILYIVLFVAAAIFSAEISEAPGTARLLLPGTTGAGCGFFGPATSSRSASTLDAFEQKVANTSIITSAYSRSCYGDNPSPLQCATFPKPSLNWTAARNASCPFATRSCKEGENAAFKMTTGLLDSRADLGINLPARYGIQYRKSTTCSPIETTPYTRIVEGRASRSLGYANTTKLVQYNYGTAAGNNYTYMYNVDTIYTQSGYSLNAVYAFPNATSNPWTVHRDLYREDADISMVFIASNSIVFPEPYNDPVFGANLAEPSENGTTLFYKTDKFVVPIACTEQYQICNPANSVCTSLVAQNQLSSASSSAAIGLNEQQRDVAARLIFASFFTSIYQNVNSRGSAALLAPDLVTGLKQYPLPPGQWMLEATSWFTTCLAHLQYSLQEYATGPTNLRGGLELMNPVSVTEKIMCMSQIVHDSQNTVSFSVLGLIIVFTIGGVIILVSLCLDVVVGWIQSRWKKGQFKRSSWILGDKLTLQRQVFLSKGLGKWEEGENWPVVMEGSGKFVGWEHDEMEKRGSVVNTEEQDSEDVRKVVVDGKAGALSTTHG